VAPDANASIVGSTYDFTASESGNTVITPLGGPALHTDPANPGLCVGSTSTAPDCASGPGLSGSFALGKVSPTVDTITFTFFGSTFLAGPGTFDVHLGHFTTLDGEVVKAVSHVSGELAEGDFSNVTFNGTDAVFTGSTSIDYNALGGTSVVFGVVISTVPISTVPSRTALLCLAVPW
jgi:hypothetical protein